MSGQPWSPAVGRARVTTAGRRAQAIEHAAMGVAPAEIAERLGISPRSVRRYLSHPDARVALRQHRDERLAQIAGQALLLAEAAMTTLWQIASDARAPAAFRVSAASRLLDVAVRFSEGVDLAERVASLEETIERLETP